MSGYINRDVARRVIDSERSKEQMLMVFDSIPEADVRENVRGKWVNNIHDLPICSQCGYMTPYDRAIDDYEYGNFCPNCGADMREVEE